MQTDITRTKLENGLTVHLKEIHTAPIISHWVWYRVGSRHEETGHTGCSHWVEHMQFKGTPQFPPGILDKVISRTGGYWNAFTHLDWTTYFETLPANEVEIALRLEADRMVNSQFEPKEVESERTVIISEREGNENEPLFRLDEAVQAASFDRHPYRHEVIGEAADLRCMTREDLYNHYRTFYTPTNAVLAVAGDFDTDEMLKRIGEFYAHIPPGSPAPCNEVEEAPLSAERRVEVRSPGETTYARAAYRSPAASHPDFLPMTVVDSLLAGPTGLNFFGSGGISNKTSRLYRALVEKELAINVSGSLVATYAPYLYEITATVRPDRQAGDVLAALDDEIYRLLDGEVSVSEIARAVKQARAQFVYGSENISNQGFWMGYAEMFASYDWFSGYLERLEQVTPDDVLRVARVYLDPSRRVVGVTIPGGDAGGQNGSH